MDHDRPAPADQAGRHWLTARRWRSWYRWVTLAMLAHPFLGVAALLRRIRHPPPPELIPLTCNEVSHLFVGLAARPLGHLAHRLRWSLWRRRHQARARTCHHRRQATWDPWRSRSTAGGPGGISPEVDAWRAPLSTSPLMTPAGLVSHLRWGEYSWFQVVLLGEENHGPWTEEDPDREMRIAVDVPIAQLLDEYEAQCARHRDLVASLDLDTRSKRPASGQPVTLRWILFHLIEETARHNGHLDILRELADGVTGT